MCGFGGQSRRRKPLTLFNKVSACALTLLALTFLPAQYALAQIYDPDLGSAVLTYTLDDTNPTVDALNNGDTLTETFTVNANQTSGPASQQGPQSSTDPNTAPTFGSTTLASQRYLPGATVNLTLPAASGGNGALRYDLFDGLFPAGGSSLGLTIDRTTRVVSGTVPADAILGEYTFTYRVSDSDTDTSLSDSADLFPSIFINPSTPTFGSTTIAPQRYLPGDTVDLTLPAASGGNGALRYNLFDGFFPAGGSSLGLTIDRTTRVVSGTVPADAILGEYTFTYRVSDSDTDTSLSDSADLFLSIFINPSTPTFGSTTIAPQRYLPGDIVDLTLPAASGGNGALRYDLFDGLFPAGGSSLGRIYLHLPGVGLGHRYQPQRLCGSVPVHIY